MAKLNCFAVLADCYGVEILVPIPDLESIPFALRMGAKANPQRHALVFGVKLNLTQTKKVHRLGEEKKFEEALRYIKGLKELYCVDVKDVALLKSIPNPALDPYA